MRNWKLNLGLVLLAIGLAWVHLGLLCAALGAILVVHQVHEDMSRLDPPEPTGDSE